MRRPAPRPIAAALDPLVGDLSPGGALARVQAGWKEVVGEAVAAEADPVGERAGAIFVACRSATWAHELSLLSDDLLERLNRALDPSGATRPVTGLRFSAARPVRRPQRRERRS